MVIYKVLKTRFTLLWFVIGLRNQVEIQIARLLNLDPLYHSRAPDRLSRLLLRSPKYTLYQIPEDTLSFTRALREFRFDRTWKS